MNSKIKRKVKIVCTLGPASNTADKIEGLIHAGMDIARLNFSHGTHEFHAGLIKTIRDCSHRLKKPVAIMQDLQGPKLRAGKIGKGGIMLKAGDVLLLYPEGSTPKMSTVGRIPIPISAEIADPISRDAKKGNRILFDDGKIFTVIRDVSPPELVVEVEIGGKLTDNKGMNLPGSRLTIPCMTDKDYKDLDFGLAQGVDAVALSFVRSAEDITQIKAHIKKISDHSPLVIAKLEREEAIELQDQIIDVTDGILIARGDMAVELGAERVPAIQKGLIHACNDLGVSVITATQMLESMVSCPTPTRAEASDVANAVYDGTDAVMLSAETASGEYPIETVQTMNRIILEAERSRDSYSRHRENIPMAGSVVDSIEFSASRIAEHVGAVAIACLTHSGMAARVLSKFRPRTPIVAIMENEQVLRRLAFNWGVQGILIDDLVGTDDLFQMVENVMQEHNWAEVGDWVVVTAGVPSLRRGTTNMIKVHKVGAQTERKRPTK